MPNRTRNSSAPKRKTTATPVQSRAPRAAKRAASSSAGAGPARAKARTAAPDAAAQAASQAAGLHSKQVMDDLKALPFAGLIDPEQLLDIQANYSRQVQQLFGAQEGAIAAPTDRRFADSSWHDGGWHALTANLYALNAQTLMRMAEAVGADERTRERVRFATQQWIDAWSPANFLATNPEAQRRVLETSGESLRAGMMNLINDLQKGRIAQTDESAFEVGRNVATTAGDVVFQNELVQLIQYRPLTEQVGERALLMIPPCINKFYILDLQPDNSVIRYALDQGNTVFVVSWRNVHEDQSTLTWDDYLQKGVVEPIGVVQKITGQEKLNMLGFCVGGTIVTTALAALAARGEHPAQSLTLLTTLLDFSDTGVLDVFVDENHVRYREAMIGAGGLMRGAELATTFSFLRPNDLVWNYVVNNYLKGERPPAFDLLYWNSDSTNLPGPMFCWYFRHMYLQNDLRKPGALTCLGQRIDLRKIDVPTYIYASREDHIVPWHAAYESTQILTGPRRFVLGASGHIAGVINPAHKNKRNYWSNDALPAKPGQWFDGARDVPGSWWPDWSQWLARQRGKMVDATRHRSREFAPIESAPGSYVKVKAQ